MSSYEKWKKRVGIIVLFVSCTLLVIFLNLGQAADESHEDRIAHLDYFTNFTLHGLNGETFTNEDLKGYKVTVINGWAPWCGPCTGEMPTFEKLRGEYKEKGLQIVGVVADYYTPGSEPAADYDTQISDTVKSTGVSYPIMVSDAAFYEKAFPTMLNAFPGTWAVDENGNLIEFISGAKSEEVWRELFDKWLEGR